MMLPLRCFFISGATYFVPSKTDPIGSSIAATKSV